MAFQANKAAGARPALLALRGQWQASAFPRFFAWWGRQLRACLPARWRAWLTRHDQPQLVRLEHDTPWLLGADGWEPLMPGAIGAESGCVLVLDEGQALVRTLVFPAGAAQDISNAVAFEMDRYTPFNAHQVYHALRRLPASPRQPLAVTLAVARRGQLDTLLKRLEGQGVRPVAVDVALPGTHPGVSRCGLDLLPSDRRIPRHRPQRRTNATLLILILCLSVASLQLWLSDRAANLEAMQQEITRLRAATGEIEGLRQQLSHGLGAKRYLAERKQATPTLGLVLSELTQCLPLDTWINQFSVDTDGQVTLAGQSAHAGNLIGELKACPSITGPQFQGVIQPDETTGKERFYLLARLHKEERPDAPITEAP